MVLVNFGLVIKNTFFIDWVAISTVSTQKDIPGYPFVNLQSMSDGPVNNSTGIPYLYMSDFDLSAIDIHVSIQIKITTNKITMLLFLERQSSNYNGITRPNGLLQVKELRS